MADEQENHQNNDQSFVNPFTNNEKLRLISFIFLFFYTMFSILFYLSHPAFTFFTYPLVFILLISWRIYSYYKEDNILYVLSPCYFVNTYLIIWLIFLNNQKESQLVLFGLINGPVYVATFVFRSTLAFDNPDKFTTCFIHLVPVAIAFQVRWYPGLCSINWWTFYNSDFKFDWIAFYPVPDVVFIYLIPLAFICGHTFLYNLIFHFCVNLKPIHMDLTRYMISEHPCFVRLGKILTRTQLLVTYIFLFCLYTAATLTLAIIAYSSFICNLLLLLVSCGWTIWFTSSYYVTYIPNMNSKSVTTKTTIEVLSERNLLNNHENLNSNETITSKFHQIP